MKAHQNIVIESFKAKVPIFYLRNDSTSNFVKKIISEDYNIFEFRDMSEAVLKIKKFFEMNLYCRDEKLRNYSMRISQELCIENTINIFEKIINEQKRF